MQNFEREDLQAPLAEINMTPLIDVMLVLVVIFLVTAPIINSAINLNLPKEKAASLSDEKSIEISIDADGNYFLNNEKLDFAILRKELKFIATKKPNHQIHLQADKHVEYQKVAKILATLQNLGLTNIGFITENN